MLLPTIPAPMITARALSGSTLMREESSRPARRADHR
jgi:hypothetical protein